MSVSNLVTVWCDWCGCWDQTGHNAKEARRFAKESGWLVNLPALPEMPADADMTARSMWSPRSRRDICPDCQKDGRR